MSVTVKKVLYKGQEIDIKDIQIEYECRKSYGIKETKAGDLSDYGYAEYKDGRNSVEEDRQRDIIFHADFPDYY